MAVETHDIAVYLYILRMNNFLLIKHLTVVSLLIYSTDQIRYHKNEVVSQRECVNGPYVVALKTVRQSKCYPKADSDIYRSMN